MAKTWPNGLTMVKFSKTGEEMAVLWKNLAEFSYTEFSNGKTGRANQVREEMV